ncbi:MAG: helix-turn-helix transcriptional regulator [Mycobacterium sp.]|nr:helix-turn-helix transcriptional regulator [Mycobacterium sp.]
MTNTDTKEVLWENVRRLMKGAYDAMRLGQFARETGIGAATMTRIRKCETSVGVDILEAIAAHFKIQTWQLLAPRLGGDLHTVTNDRRVLPILDVVPEPVSDDGMTALSDAAAASPTPDKSASSRRAAGGRGQVLGDNMPDSTRAPPERHSDRKRASDPRPAVKRIKGRQ